MHDGVVYTVKCERGVVLHNQHNGTSCAIEDLPTALCSNVKDAVHLTFKINTFLATELGKMSTMEHIAPWIHTAYERSLYRISLVLNVLL